MAWRHISGLYASSTDRLLASCLNMAVWCFVVAKIFHLVRGEFTPGDQLAFATFCAFFLLRYVSERHFHLEYAGQPEPLGTSLFLLPLRDVVARMGSLLSPLCGLPYEPSSTVDHSESQGRWVANFYLFACNLFALINKNWLAVFGYVFHCLM